MQATDEDDNGGETAVERKHQRETNHRQDPEPKSQNHSIVLAKKIYADHFRHVGSSKPFTALKCLAGLLARLITYHNY